MLLPTNTDLRGYTVRLRNGAIASIPEACLREEWKKHVSYYIQTEKRRWGERVDQSASCEAPPFSSGRDIIKVFPNADATVFSRDLDLRGRTVILRGSCGKHPVVTIPRTSQREEHPKGISEDAREGYVSYSWQAQYESRCEEQDDAGICHQLVGEQLGCTMYDIIEVLPVLSEKLDEGPQPCECTAQEDANEGSTTLHVLGVCPEESPQKPQIEQEKEMRGTTQVRRELGKLRHLAEVLENPVAKLEERLECVTHDKEPEDNEVPPAQTKETEADEAPPAPKMVPLAGKIHVVASQLNDLHARLESLVNRCEL